MTTLRAGSATHTGQVRSNNQDSKLVVVASQLYGVADGMGGHQGGEVASAMAVEMVERHADEPTLDTLQHAVRVANRAIFEKAGSDRDLHGMGTTFVAIQLVTGPEGDEIAWVNVGDSRVYLQRDDELIQLSQDHSLVEDLVRDGQISQEEAAVHPQRNILTRALGIDLDVSVDGATVLPFTGDRFLMCSDGLFNEVSEDQITSVLRRLADPTEAAEELVRLANEGGGRDNITVVVVEVVDDGGRSQAASAAIAGDATTVVAAVPAAVTAPVDDDPDAPVFADRRSSLPEASDDYGAEKDDLFGDVDHARTRRITWRVLVFLVAILAVLGVVAGAIGWSARNTYYVGFSGDQVALYKGKPGGVLWFDPVLDDTFDLERADITPAVREVLDGGKEFSSETKARQYVFTIQQDIAERTGDDPTTSTTTPGDTTTTTVAGGVTTTAPVTTTTPQTPTTAAP